MNAEEIRKKAIECGENFATMCASNIAFDDNFSAKCADNCEYIDTGLERCSAVYGYEHGFADGAEEERRRIYEEYQKAVKADSEASIHGDMFPKNEERFWQEMRGKYENR